MAIQIVKRILPLAALWTFCSCSGTVEVYLKSYTSYDGRESDGLGTCCESFFSSSNCEACDPFIEIALTDSNKPGLNISQVVTSNVYQNTNNVTFTNSLGNVSNPFRLNFQEFTMFGNVGKLLSSCSVQKPTYTYYMYEHNDLRINTSLKLQFKVWDDDSLDRSPSTPDKLEDLEFPVGQGEPDTFSSTPSFTHKLLKGTTLELQFDYRIQCSVDYFGNCGVFCHPQLNQYTCDSQGRRRCEPGWTGVNCTDHVSVDVCAHHLCVHDSTCVSNIGNYTCTCTEKYTGRFCETQIVKSSTAPRSTSTKQPSTFTTRATLLASGTTSTFLTGSSVISKHTITSPTRTPSIASAVTNKPVSPAAILSVLTIKPTEATPAFTTNYTQTFTTNDDEKTTFPMIIGIISGAAVVTSSLLAGLIVLIKRVLKRNKVKDECISSSRECVQIIENKPLPT